ncbi:MAG: alkaline phosphatase [Rikenellaceae bacterium]|nr:alkaline phosphatase [Rikenellaceae bacterium]
MKKAVIYLLSGFAALLFLRSTVSCSGGRVPETPQVRNVIYMIGDGMGLAQVSALMLEHGFAPINMERAQAVGLVKTYSANNRVTDSAAAGTALAAGTKTNNSVLGIDPEGNHLESVMTKALRAGFGTGLVVTCPITDATPGAFYAHVASRREYETIAAQLVESGINVFMGGGRRLFNDREDGVDLYADLREKGYTVVEQLSELDETHDGRVACLIDEFYPPYAGQGRGDYLPRAVAKTLEILSNNSGDGKGFFLMIEGSQIDGAGHKNDIENVLGEMQDFDDTVGVVLDFADRNPGTLVVILADHETGGLSLVPGDADFERGESGVSASFATGGHSAILIPMFAYGPGAENFTGVFDNTEIPGIIESLILP